MAITGAAAIVGGVAAGLTGATTVIAIAGLAITAVGLITKNQTLMKIGGGLSLGSSAAGLAGGAAAGASGAADATTAGINAPSVADAAGAGSQAAGDVAAQSTAAATATSTPADLIAGYGASAVDPGLIGGAAAQTSTEAAISGAGGLNGSVAPVDPALNSAAANGIDQNLAAVSPAQQAVQSDVAASTNVNPANVNAANANPANINPANTNTIAQNTATASPVAPGTQAPNAATATTGSGAPYAFNSATAYTPVQNGLQAPSSWWQDTLSWFQDPKNNSLMQVGGGLLKGVGQGALTALAPDSRAKILGEQYAFERANLSGAGAIPTVNMRPSGAASPYKNPTQVQQAADAAVKSTTTPAYPGIINKQRS